MNKRVIGVLFLHGAWLLSVLGQRVEATPCWGVDDAGAGAFRIAPTDNGGTSYASIAAAVVAGKALREVIQFDGAWTGIDESIKLYNRGGSGQSPNPLTYQGDADGTSMTWNTNLNAFVHEFGADHGPTPGYNSFDITFRRLAITASGSGRGISWDVWNANANAAKARLEDVTLISGQEAVWLSNGRSGDASSTDMVILTVSNSLLRAGTNSNNYAIYTRCSQSFPNRAYVYGSRIETRGHGIFLRSGNKTDPSTDQNTALRVEGTEIVNIHTTPRPAGSVGIHIPLNNFADSASEWRVAGCLITGFDTGVRFRQHAYTADLLATFLGNTFANNGVGLAVETRHGDTHTVFAGNNIFAGNGTGLSQTTSQASDNQTVAGRNNAFFDNTNDIVQTGPGTEATTQYSSWLFLADGFSDTAFGSAGTGNYRLTRHAAGLLDAGQEYSSGSIFTGYTVVFVDHDVNGAYDVNKDYIVDLGGYTGSVAGHRLLLNDAGFAVRQARRSDDDNTPGARVNIGAYEDLFVPPPSGTVIHVR